MWIIVIVVGGLFGMPCLLRFTHAADDELCRKCGYDLRGSLGLVCPECGGRREATARRTEASSPENVATREAGWR
jgi:anaerobic ribonucleoside-triphosphate reductase